MSTCDGSALAAIGQVPALFFERDSSDGSEAALRVCWGGACGPWLQQALRPVGVTESSEGAAAHTRWREPSGLKDCTPPRKRGAEIVASPRASLRVVEDNLHIRAAKLFTMLLLPRPLPAPRSACAARILAHLVPFTRACACLVSLLDGRCRSRSSPAIPFSTFRTRRAEDASIAFSGRAR